MVCNPEVGISDIGFTNDSRKFEGSFCRGFSPTRMVEDHDLSGSPGFRAVNNDRRLRLVKTPQELHAFHFLMAWHPRLNTDPRHVWLREAVRSTVAPNGSP